MTLLPFDPPAMGPRIIAPGAVHLPVWLTATEQTRIVRAFHEWAAGPVPARAAVLPGGGVMSVETVCLGWHWQPYKYTRTATDVNGRRVLAVPVWLAELGRAALAAAHGPSAAEAWWPDAVLVNFYADGTRMGMHQDREEAADAPVVSLSVGDDCLFRFGNTRDRGRPFTDVRLTSGDAFVFGEESRHAYHGVPKIYPGTAPSDSALQRGRINVTMRVTGLDG